MQVWWVPLVAADLALLDLLDPSEQDRVWTLERPADRGRSMLGAALLRVAVGEHLGLAPQQLRIDRTCQQCGKRHGAPRVLGGRAQAVPHVSVSHSGLLVVVALSADTPIGVDVQRVADLREPLGPEAEQSAEDWVRGEATHKVGGGTVQPAVRPLRAPLDGYAAALATLTDRPPTDAELLIRHWPEGPPGPGSGDT